MSSNLLTTKLFIPPARKNLVPRPRLLEVLNEARLQEKKLTLVSASAGYGKTTLVSEWLRSLPTQSAWLTLDKTDNDPARFLAYLIAALQQVDGRIGENTQALLQSPQALPPEITLTALINEIAAVNAPFTLVLDDYHLVAAMPVHQQLDFLVEHKPPQMHLVIITREDPPLPLARLRAHGEMVEIRQDDLRFSQTECADFLQRIMGIHLSVEDVFALERRTEGWIAGLQLAALSMQGCDDLPGFVSAFTGSSHYVLDYLIEEVFERQPADEQDFLLKTSILERLSGPLCDAVADRSGSSLLLDRLEHANLFIVALDQPRTWYRYHHLFADLLRQRLQSTRSQSENELHQRASRWFAAEGFFPEAIHHALAGSDWEGAADLIGGHAVVMLRRGELITLLGWLRSLPDAVVFVRPQLCRDYGWVLTLTGQLDAADAYLRQAEVAAAGNQAVLGTILVAQAYNLRMRGNHPQAIDRAQRAQALLPQEDHLSRGLVALTLGFAYWNCGDLGEAEKAFIEVDRAAQRSQNHYARMTALAYIAVIQAVYGRLHRAAELCRQVIQMGGQSPTVAPAHIELGALLYEWNDLDSAAEHLNTGIESSQRTGNYLIQSDGFRTLALLELARGEVDAAEAALQRADQLAERHEVTPLTRMRNAACQVQLALARHDLAAAQFWADKVSEPADASPFYPRLGLAPARLMLARDDKAGAALQLAELFELAHQAGWTSGAIHVRTLQALAAETPADALHFMEDALQMAQPEGFTRTFVDEGEPMKALLERMRSQGGELKEYVLTLLAAFGETRRAALPQPFIERYAPQGGSEARTPQGGSEALSEREMDVLELVAQGLSNVQIAERLVVSLGTIKTHVHNILGKLGVSNRTQAVAQAKALGFL